MRFRAGACFGQICIRLKRHDPSRAAAVRRIVTESRSSDQKLNLSANWIWRIGVAIDVILPNVAEGAGLEPLLQLNWPPAVNSTWLGALNISMRNSRFLLSEIWNNLITEISSFPSQGPRSGLRPQLPNVPAMGFENAAALNHPFALLLGRTGFTPDTQLSRVAFETKLVPPESHEDVFTTPPLCSAVMVLSCQPPTTWFAIPP